MPTVRELAASLHVSANYLSDMLRSQTGQNVRHYIHDKLIEKAKELISTTSLSVSEIAYTLGFEHPQSFHKLFKSKTKLSPLEFRQSFTSLSYESYCSIGLVKILLVIKLLCKNLHLSLSFSILFFMRVRDGFLIPK